MKISIVIPVRNAAATLAECLQAIDSSFHSDREVIVVDDDSSDDTPEIARRHGCRTLTQKPGRGPAAARNRGAREANGEIVLFIDADIRLRPDSLSQLALAFQDPEVVAVTGLLSEYNRFPNFSSQYKNLWMRFTYILLPDNISLFYTSIAAIRKEAFLALGGFDEQYRSPCVEDTAFGNKLWDEGYKVKLRRDLEVEHLKRYSLTEVLCLDFRRSADLTRLGLRTRLTKWRSGNRTSVPDSFILSILFSSSALAALAVFLVTGAAFWGWAAPIGLGLAVFANFDFINWLGKVKDRAFAIKSCFMILLDFIAVAAGIAWGLATYLSGKKY